MEKEEERKRINPKIDGKRKIRVNIHDEYNLQSHEDTYSDDKRKVDSARSAYLAGRTPAAVENAGRPALDDGCGENSEDAKGSGDIAATITEGWGVSY